VYRCWSCLGDRAPLLGVVAVRVREEEPVEGMLREPWVPGAEEESTTRGGATGLIALPFRAGSSDRADPDEYTLPRGRV
jgi:hypothetical protein